jgi:hypothetical protein
MKVIKFRAYWNGDSIPGSVERSRMYEWDELLRWDSIHPGYLPVLSTVLLQTHPNWSVMQFIGILDANGREIYEGDIIDTANDIGVAIYDEHCGMYLIRKVREKLSGDLCITGSLYWDKVIGNIHENPELLEKQNATS